MLIATISLRNEHALIYLTKEIINTYNRLKQ